MSAIPKIVTLLCIAALSFYAGKLTVRAIRRMRRD